MPKVAEITADDLSRVTPVPRAATKPRQRVPASAGAPVNDTPIQIRVPKAEAKAIRVAARESEQSISDFMLACFHATMKRGKAR